MSTNEVKLNKGNHAFLDINTKKIFLFNNEFQKGIIDEPSGSGPTTIKVGTVIGRIHASGKYKIHDATATDGSQFPIGVVAKEVTLAQSATSQPLHICVRGKVDETGLIFTGSQTLATNVTVSDSDSGATEYVRSLRDLLQSAGIQLTASTEMTKHDNS